MKRSILLIGALSVCVLFSCKTNKLPTNKVAHVNELQHIVDLMSGQFSSKEQSVSDSLFYDINLVMHPIWENDTESKWLYVEQAVSSNLKKPYRQRIYKVSKLHNGLIESKVYELPNPESYVHAWTQPKLFNAIGAGSLIIREGCAVFLERNSNNCYIGSTNERDCKSTFREATYATSKVSICPDQISSWDQGWNNEDKQVWGASTGGYIFKRISANDL